MAEHAHTRKRTRSDRPLRVLVAGAGVAGLEGLLALHDLAGDRVQLTLLAPEDEFVHRPMSVYQAFAAEDPRHYPLGPLIDSLDAEHVHDSFKWLDPHRRVVHTEAGERLRYDALLLAIGARRHPRFAHAVTIDDCRLGAQLQPVVDAMQGPRSPSVALVVPSQPTWPLPIYELALMISGRSREHGHRAKITVITPEACPLEVFGGAVSDAVSATLREAGVEVITGQTAQVHEPHVVSLYPSDQHLEADHVYALPELYGPSVPGIPTHAERGFLSVDQHCAIAGLERVYAAGDAVDFPVKFGGVSAQQADTAARAIAVLAGAPVELHPLQTTIRGVLLGGDQPLYMQAQVSYLHGVRSTVSSRPAWDASEKVSARYLTEYLGAEDRVQPVVPAP